MRLSGIYIVGRRCKFASLGVGLELQFQFYGVLPIQDKITGTAKVRVESLRRGAIKVSAIDAALVMR